MHLSHRGECVFNRILQVSLVLIVILAPLPFGSVQEPWLAVWRGAIAILLLLWALMQILQRRVSLVGTGLGWWVALLLGYVVLMLASMPSSLLNHISPEASRLYRLASEAATSAGLGPATARISLAPAETLGALLQLASCAVLFFLSVHVLRYQRAFVRAGAAMVASGTAVALIGIAQNVWSNGKIYWVFASGSGTPFGPFVNHNHFAGYMELVLGMALGMFAAEVSAVRERQSIPGLAGYFSWIWDRTGGRALMLAVCSLVIAAALSVSLSRGGVLSVLLTAILFSTALFTAKVPNSRAVTLGLLLVLALVAVLVISPRVRSRWQAGLDESGRYRIAVWGDTLRMASEFPVTGSGLGSFRSVFPRFRSFVLQSETTHAENEYLQWLAETGVVGTLILLWIAVVFGSRIGARFAKRKDPYVRCLTLGVLFGLFAFLTHNAMDFNFHIPANAMTFVVLAAIALLCISTHRGERFDTFLLHVSSIPLWSRRGLTAATCALATAGLLFAGALSEWRTAWIGTPAQGARTSSWNDPAHFRFALECEAQAAAKGLLQFRERSDLLLTAEQSLLEAIMVRPSQASYWAALGRVRASRQKPDAAEASFRIAAELAPLNGFVHRDYAIFQLRQGQIEAGVSRLSLARVCAESLSLKELLEIVASRTGDTNEWHRLVRWQPGDLRTYADFLKGRGLTDEARAAEDAAHQLETGVQ